MRLDGLRDRLQSTDPWVRWALAAWLALLVAVCGRVAFQPRTRTLFTTWAGAGRNWESGQDLYQKTWESHQDQFRYSPPTAVLLVPFGHLPVRGGGVLWRLLNAAVLLSGFAAWLRAGVPQVRSSRGWAMAYLLILPLSLGSLNNGQPNPAVIGLLLWAAALVVRDRWMAAAACVALATVWKAYPLAVGLLLAAAYPRRFGPRLVLALAVAAALPFLCQRWGYVASQYAQWVRKLWTENNRKGWPLEMAYRDLWLLLRVCHLRIPERAYQVLQLGTAAAAAVLCVLGRRRGWDRRQVVLAVLALGTCWMTLLGPATESATYVLLAPVLAWAVLSATRQPWTRWGAAVAEQSWPAAVRWMPAAAWWLFLACVLAGLVPWTKRIHALGLHPLAALLLTAACAVVIYRAATAGGPGANAGAGAPPPARAA
jgi:hypothetical protein